MNINVMYTWVGKHDLEAPSAPEPNRRPGPVADAVCHLVKEHPAAWRVVLLHDYGNDAQLSEGIAYRDWLEARLPRALRVEVEQIGVPKTPEGDPTDYTWVYENMRRVIAEHEQALGKQVKRHYLIGPGTPTMAACTLIISRLRGYEGVSWQTDVRHPKGVRKLELPFDLVLMEAPDPQSDWSVPESGIILRSKSTKDTWELASRAARSSVPVLILGSTGVGKESLAQHIHEKSGRTGELKTINCAAIPAELIESELFGHRKGAFSGAQSDRVGIFESAKGGTVFLDEIGELPLMQQGKLLRVLQEKKIRRVGENEERPVDFRLVSATHRDLWQMTQEGRFREDLYYRISPIILTLKDLKDRAEDLEEMIVQFWRDTIRDNQGFPGRILTEDAKRLLKQYDWPGNVRELKNTLLRAAFLAKDSKVDQAIIEKAMVLGKDRSFNAQKGATSPETGSMEEHVDWKARLLRCKQRMIEEALQQTGGNKSEAARRLGITPQQLSRVLKSAK